VSQAPPQEHRYIKDLAITFAMYCDENNYSLKQGRELAEHIGRELETTADERISYLPPEKVDA